MTTVRNGASFRWGVGAEQFALKQLDMEVAH